MFNALYCSMLYRNKKVKKYQEGFVRRSDSKIMLLNNQKVVIDSIFDKSIIDAGNQYDMDRNYCIVESIVDTHALQGSETSKAPVVLACKVRTGLKRSKSLLNAPISKPNANSVQGQICGSREVVQLNESSIEPTETCKKPKITLQQSIQSYTSKNNDHRSYADNVGINANCSIDTFDDDPFEDDQFDTLLLGEDISQNENDALFVNGASKIPSDSHIVNLNLKSSEENIKALANLNSSRFGITSNELMLLFSNDSVSVDASITDIKVMTDLKVKAGNDVLYPPSFARKLEVYGEKSNKKSKISSKAVTKIPAQIKPVFQPRNEYNLTFDTTIMKKSKYRIKTIDNTMSNVEEYQRQLTECVKEQMSLDLSQVSDTCSKILYKNHFPEDKDFKRNRIRFYRNTKLKHFEPNDSKAFQYSADLNSRQDNVILGVLSKEHYSVYSKDDIWLISTSIQFHDACFFKSFYFGPSGLNIELVPISKHFLFEQWFDGRSLFAIQAMNASHDISLLKNIADLADCPMTQHLIANTDIRLESLLSSTLAQEFDQLVSNAVIEFKFNQDQARSIRGQDGPIILVHGVYGAGKSFVLSALIVILYRAYNISLLSESTRIVISSMTNVAVDRILNTLLKMNFNDFVRVGSLKKISKSILPFTCQYKNKTQGVKELQEMLEDTGLSEADRTSISKSIKLYDSQDNHTLLKNAFLIGLTTAATSFEIVDGIECSIAILDECSQMNEPMSLQPICRFRSSYAVLVGDPKQLAPTLKYSIDPSVRGFGLERTLFERLASWIEPILLRTQYRCHPEISSITNTCFYDDKLVDGVDSTSRLPLIRGLRPVSFVTLQSNESKSPGGSYFNNAEAALIKAIIVSLLENGIDPIEIGVISLYKKQAEIIQDKIEKSVGILTSTVDAFQGSEKNVIILSTVRTAPSGFLEEPRRINVALTRSR